MSGNKEIESSLILTLQEDSSIDEFDGSLDERINQKIAVSLKNAVHLIIDKFESFISNRVKIVVKDELDHRMN